MTIDTHIHLSHFLFDQTFPFLAFENGAYHIQSGTREALIRQFQTEGITACIDPGIEIDSNKRILELAEKYPSFVFPSVGIHPTRTFQCLAIQPEGTIAKVKLHWNQRKELSRYADHPQVVAIGETGLDYHLKRKEQHRLRQKAWFIWQIRLADEKKLPLILHIRDAHKDAIHILKCCRSRLHGGICHCFTETAEIAKQYTDLGFHLGIGGSLLLESPKRSALEDAVIKTPLECLLLETDGPYVKPDLPDFEKKAARKARNTSLILPAVIDRIAELKGITKDEVRKTTTENAVQLFGLPVHSPDDTIET